MKLAALRAAVLPMCLIAAVALAASGSAIHTGAGSASVAATSPHAAASTLVPAAGASSIAAAAAPASRSQEPPLAPKYEAWRNEVADIVSDDERRVFLALESDRERDLFIEEFWKQRDPSPGTPRNEYKAEHYRRLEFVDKTFGRKGKPGSGRLTDRGRIYIKLGMPFDVQRITSTDVYGCEIWSYHGQPRLGQPAVFRLLFYQPRGAGAHELYDPLVDRPSDLVVDPDRDTHSTYSASRSYEGIATVSDDIQFPQSWDTRDRQAYRILREFVSTELTQAVLSIIPGVRDASQFQASSVWLDRIETSPQLIVQSNYADDFLKHKASVEINYSVFNIGHRARAWVLREPGGPFFVNYLLVPERMSLNAYQDNTSADLRTSLRVTDAAGRTVFQQEKDCSVELSLDEMKLVETRAVHFVDAFPLVSGRYQATLLWENAATREFTTVDLGIEVPSGTAPSMSPLLLSRSIVKGGSGAGGRRAFQVGDYQINPLIDLIFQPKDRLYVFAQLHNLPAGLRETGAVEARIIRAGAAEDERRRDLTELDGTPEVLNVFETFALDPLEPGAHVIELSIRDAAGEVRLSTRETFSISAVPLRGTWVIGPSNPGPADPAQDYFVGSQLLGLGRVEEALAAMAEAHRERPEDLEFAIGYAGGLVSTGRAADALTVLRPLATAGESRDDFQSGLGVAALAAGEFREALEAYRKTLSIRGRTAETLNAIGECHRALGELDAAAEAWRQSLAINPEQPRIKQRLEELKKAPAEPDRNAREDG